jgi:hypothetical protein
MAAGPVVPGPANGLAYLGAAHGREGDRAARVGGLPSALTQRRVRPTSAPGLGPRLRSAPGLPAASADVMLNRSLGRSPSALGTLHRSQPLSSVGRCPRMARHPRAIARSVYHGRRASCAADVFSSPPTAPCAAPLQPFGCTPAPGAAATGGGGRRRSSLLPPLSPDQSELDKAKLRAVPTPCAACVRARCMFVRACACACVGACLCVCVAGCERRKT